MNKRTKKLAVVAAILFALVVVAVLMFVRQIYIQSDKLSQQITAIQTDRAQQTVFTRIERTSKETEPVRETLQSYYLQSQSDSIDFLNFIEAQADLAGIELETNSPTEVVRDGATYLSVEYEYTGSRSRVETFTKQLENVPYVSQLQSLNMTQLSGNSWQATVTIEVHVLNYETI